MSKFGSDIRRIVHYDEIMKKIRELTNRVNSLDKAPIDSNKSIAYLEKKSLRVVTNSAVGAAHLPTDTINHLAGTGGDSAASGANDALADQKSGSSQSNTTSNPENGINSWTDAAITSANNLLRDGWYDAQSILDYVTDSYGKNPPVFSDGLSAVDQYSGDLLNTLTGLTTDDTLRSVIVHFGDALWSLIGDSSWDSAWTPIVDPTWNTGRVWTLTYSGTGLYGRTFDELTASMTLNSGLTYIYGISGSNVSTLTPDAGDDLLFSGNAGGVVGNPYGGLGGVVFSFSAYDGLGNSAGHYKQIPCTGTGHDSYYCSTTPAYATHYASDLGATQLAWATQYTPTFLPVALSKAGRFIPSPYDLNIPTNFTDGASILDLKTLSGTPVRIRPLKNGQWAVYERNPAASNAPAGNTYDSTVLILNTNRSLFGFITPSQLTTLLP